MYSPPLSGDKGLLESVVPERRVVGGTSGPGKRVCHLVFGPGWVSQPCAPKIRASLVGLSAGPVAAAAAVAAGGVAAAGGG